MALVLLVISEVVVFEFSLCIWPYFFWLVKVAVEINKMSGTTPNHQPKAK